MNFVFRTQCATQFIHLLSSEANEICEKKHNKRTIAPEHAFTALENLGFGTMVKEGTNALNEYKSAVAKKRRKSHRLENLGIPVEELLKQQQELFAKVCFIMHGRFLPAFIRKAGKQKIHVILVLVVTKCS